MAQGGEIVYRRAAGMADREAGKPMACNTLFRLASVSKPIVSTAALALMARGDMRLTIPLPAGCRIFVRGWRTAPSVVDAAPFNDPYRRVKLPLFSAGRRMLRTIGRLRRMDEAAVSLPENVRRIASAPLLAPPGAEWRYSIATDVLGAVIERASGLPLAQAVKNG